MENFGKLMAGMMLLICGVLLQFVVAHIIFSIATLYVITFITQFTFAQIVGTLLIIKIVRSRYTKSDDSNPGEFFEEASKGLLLNLLSYLFIWGMAFVIYQIWFY